MITDQTKFVMSRPIWRGKDAKAALAMLKEANTSKRYQRVTIEKAIDGRYVVRGEQVMS